MIPLPLHGIGSRRDLPLPFEFWVGGSALALVATFVVLLSTWRQPRLEGATGTELPRLGRWLSHPFVLTAARVAVLAANLWFAMALVWGQDLITNPVFGWVYAWWWVGLVPVSLLVGNIWATLHPAASIARWLGRRNSDDGPEAVWLASLGILAFAWLELVQPGRATLDVLGWWVLGYWLVMVGGALWKGPGWVRRADPFSAYAATVAALSPWQWTDGTLRLVNPLRHVVNTPARPGTALLVSCLLGATAFDSLSGGTWWVSMVQGSAAPVPVWGTVGLAAMIAVVWVTFTGATTFLQRRSTRASGVSDLVAASMAPIVAGYAIGHYASLLLVEGQRTFIHASDPLGLGWNVFGTAEWGVWLAWIEQPTAVAMVQLLAIVVGHIVGVVTAHELSLRVLPQTQRVIGQIPLLVVMVLYTCAGLWLLFSA